MISMLSPLLGENALFKDIGEVFHPIFELFGLILAGIYAVVPSYGFAITGLTIIIMLALTPITIKSTKSMLAMQRLQPEMKKLQAKYKGPENREQLNAEMMKLYKENGTSPFGACMPMLLQTPFLIVLYSLNRAFSPSSTDRMLITGCLPRQPSGGCGRVLEWAPGPLRGGRTAGSAPGAWRSVRPLAKSRVRRKPPWHSLSSSDRNGMARRGPRRPPDTPRAGAPQPGRPPPASLRHPDSCLTRVAGPLQGPLHLPRELGRFAPGGSGLHPEEVRPAGERAGHRPGGLPHPSTKTVAGHGVATVLADGVADLGIYAICT